MPSLKAIKTKIKSTGNLKKISRALEVISTIKLQKNKAKVESAKQYFLDLATLISEISQKLDIYEQEAEKPKSTEDAKKLIIVVSSEKGLCGGLNSKITKILSNNYSAQEYDIFVIGKKGFEYCKRAGYAIVGYINLKDEVQQADLQPLFDFLREHKKTYSTIDIVFNYFNNVLNQIASGFKLYPLSKESIESFLMQVGVELTAKDNQSKSGENKGFELLEPSLEQVRDELQKQIINYIITATVLQNKLAEHAGRMIAMKGAKDNCTKVIGTLTLQFNKLRQANITKEISEITAAKIAME